MCSPNPLAAIWGLFLRGGEKREGERRNGKGPSHFFVQVYAPVPIVSSADVQV